MHAANLLTDRARLTPDREALLELETGQRFTYAELNRRANRVANWLLDYDIKAGDRVAILAHNSATYLDLFFACGKIGAIFNPLNWRLAAGELSYIVNDSGPRFLIFGPEFEDTVEAMRADIHVDHVVSLADHKRAVAKRTTLEPPRPASIDGETPYCILYTSGTTGRPKGAIIPHRQVLMNCVNTIVGWGLREDDVSPVLTPMFHAGGLFAFLCPVFYMGGRIVLARGFDAEESLRVIIEEKCTVILGVPTLFQMWMNSAQFAPADFSHVRFFISGGAPCPVPLMDAWRRAKGIVFRQGYGLTEVGPNCFSMTDAESVAKAGTVGKPIINTEMRLADKSGREVDAGETGELLIKGPHVCGGYWQNPEATAEALRDGWFHTGDMARRDQDGYYSIVGRFKDMIISGGENVYAAEVEAVFHEHPCVVEAALIGKPDEKWGEVGLMVVVLKPDETVRASELKAFCRQRLAPYKVPKEIVFAPELPHSPYGKVEKLKLQEIYLAREQ
jgi:fatty-acyl-CoA synthase